MVVQRAHWVQQQAMKECGTVIRIDLDFKNAFNSAGHSCLWAILRGLGVPDVDFLGELYKARKNGSENKFLSRVRSAAKRECES